MGSFSDGSSQNKMSLLRGCFGCSGKSNELSEKKTKKNRLSLVNCMETLRLQRTDVSETGVCKSTEEKKRQMSLLSRVRGSMNRPLLKITERCTVFLRNFKMNRRYYQALKSEGLLVSIASSVASPVLNIAWLFTDGEITNTRQSFHSSCQKYNWDIVIYTGISDEMKANFNYDRVDEPILDGLPCSYWLEVMEPTIPVILELFSLRHRKTNLSRLRAMDYVYEDFMTRHGDTFMEQLDPDMQGPHQILVNRIHNTPFPTMELGSTAAIVHNAMVNREHQFQEPFRCRRPNHRSRCTTRPRPVSILRRGQGCTPVLVQDIDPNPNVYITTQNAIALVDDPVYPESIENRDSDWYVPVILQLAACSQLQFPDGCSYRSDDDISERSESDVVCSQGSFLEVNGTSCDNNIVGRSGKGVTCLSSNSPGVIFDDAIAGCSDMGVELCSSETSVNGFLNCKSEIDELLTTEDNTSERLCKSLDDSDVDEYVDSILEKAVTSIGSIQERYKNAPDLPPWYSSSIDITDPISNTTFWSSSSIASGSSEACNSRRDIEEHSISCSPCPNDYHDECVIDEMALMNLNQSSFICKYIDHPEHCMINSCLRNAKQISPMLHPNHRCSKLALSAANGGNAVPNIMCFPEDCLSVRIALLNTNQSARNHHTKRRFRNRCEHSPDTWFYDAYENVYKPEKLRPDISDLRFQKKMINLYIKGMTDATICNPEEPDILCSLEGRDGALDRRFFVHCATQLLNEIDKKVPRTWIPTKKQRWEFRNRSEGSGFLVEEDADTEPDTPNRQQVPILERTQRKYTIVNGEHRKVVLKKKRKTKRRNTFHVSNSKDKKKTARFAEDSTEDTDDDLPGNRKSCSQESTKNILKHDREGEIENHIQSRGDESQGSTFPSSEHCNLNEKAHSAKYEHAEEIWKRHIQSQNEAFHTSSQRNRRVNVACGSRSGDKSQISRMDQIHEGKRIKVNNSHDSFIGNISTVHRKSNSRSITSTLLSKPCARKQNSLYSKQNRQSSIKVETFSEYTPHDVTSNRRLPTKEQGYSQRIYVGANADALSVDAQPSDSTDQPKHSLKKCTVCTGDSDANKNGIHHVNCQSHAGRQRHFDAQKKYASTNDADSSSSDCKDEPRKKSKVRCRKKKRDTVQRKQTVLATEIGLDGNGTSCCFLSSESKQILARRNTKSKLLNSDEGSLSSDNGSRQFLNENSEAIPITTADRSQYVHGNTDRLKSTAIWSLNETSSSSYYSDVIDLNDTDSADTRERIIAPNTSLLEKNCCKDAVNEDCTGDSSSTEWNDSCRTEEEDFSYDTDASSSDSLLGDDRYLIVNLSDTFHSESSGGYSSPYIVCSGHWEIGQESDSYSSDYSSEYSSAQQNMSSHSVASNKTSVVYTTDRGNDNYSFDDESSAFSKEEHPDSDGFVSTKELDHADTTKHVSSERKTITQTKHKHIPFKCLQVSEGTLTSSRSDNQNDSISVETDVKDHVKDKCKSGDMSYNTEEPYEPSAETQENSSASDSSSDERPVKLRDQQRRRFYDVGDWVTSVDAVRRHRESRRQRGILQYQWNGMCMLSDMYTNPVGQGIRRLRGQIRAWLDRL